MYIDPITLNWIMIGAASLCAAMIGYYWARRNDEEIIANTITYLAQEGFVKSFHNSDGELELIKLNEKLPTEEE
jgi:hypothetical protein